MNKSHGIEFYFDCSSPWTYLAFTEILPLSQRQNVEIIWKPVLVGGIFNTVNKDVYEFRMNPNPLKLKYSNSDLNLWAQVRKLNISMPKIFPINSVKAMRGCLFADQEQCLSVFAKEVFDAYWGHGLDISEESIIMGIAETSGLPLEKFQRDILAFPMPKRYTFFHLQFPLTLHKIYRIVHCLGYREQLLVLFLERLEQTRKISRN